MTRKKGPAYKMKASAYGGPMRKNFPSAFRTETEVEVEADMDEPYIREKGTVQPNIEGSTGISEASLRAGTYNKPTEAGGSFSTPGLDNLWTTIQKMEPGKKRDEGIEYYKKKREEMTLKLRKEHNI